MNEKIKRKAEEAGLPVWVIDSISSIAWDRGHAYGQEEVDHVADEMIDTLIENKERADRSTESGG